MFFSLVCDNLQEPFSVISVMPPFNARCNVIMGKCDIADLNGISRLIDNLNIVCGGDKSQIADGIEISDLIKNDLDDEDPSEGVVDLEYVHISSDEDKKYDDGNFDAACDELENREVSEDISASKKYKLQRIREEMDMRRLQRECAKRATVLAKRNEVVLKLERTKARTLAKAEKKKKEKIKESEKMHTQAKIIYYIQQNCEAVICDFFFLVISREAREENNI